MHVQWGVAPRAPVEGDEASSAAENGGGVCGSDYRIYVGNDRASEGHQACVLDDQRRIVAERSFAHTGNGIAEFARWLSGLTAAPEQLGIAIEIPQSAVGNLG